MRTTFLSELSRRRELTDDVLGAMADANRAIGLDPANAEAFHNRAIAKAV